MRAFVVAMENEAAQVRPVLGGDDLLFVSGVGKVNAAAATQKAIDAGADVVLNCGVAGGLDPLMNVGDVYEIEKAVEYDFDLTMLNGTRIGTHNERDTPFFGCRASGAFPARTLATGDRFTNDERDVSVPLSLGATVKDMEGAAVAHVCEANGVPCRMLKCISDVHGKGEMTGQYKDNLAKALACLRDALTSWT
ncbi:MAG: 5'-methylthioadenosine/S-adenosylhomocysteine nucleosidase [Kiritimatiellae bacterium]|nr:5'-methylthioadenosine/S-adenosylhomocysteine nucleosidase [Kiritimatiellia bacterium]